MTEEDHLDKETALSLKLDETGVQAKAKSRLIASLDRLGGNLFEFGNVYIEEKIASKRARIDATKLVTRAASETVASEVREDREFAHRVLQSEFSKMAMRYENKAQVLKAAPEQLRLSPPSGEQSTSGPEQLSDSFLNKFERYAEDASDEVARQKWAKVLAEEVKSPGRFSPKAMRTLDEIDGQTARWFSDLVACRIGTVIPKVLHNNQYQATSALLEDGLIHDVFPGTEWVGQTEYKVSGEEISMLVFGDFAFAFQGSDLKTKASGFKNRGLVHWNNDKNQLAMPVIALSSTGIAISAILEDPSAQNAGKLLPLLKEFDPGVTLLARSPTNSMLFEPIQNH